MATRLYLSRKVPTYYPANFRGSWNLTGVFNAATSCSADTNKATSGGNYSTGNILTQVSSTNPYDTCNLRIITPPLASGITIAGTVDAFFSTLSANVGQSQYTRIYAYVTAGDTATVRGVLLDYVEPSGTSGKEWAKTTAGARSLTQQTMSSVIASAGDRIVIELGSRNYTTTASSSSIGFGSCDASTSLPFADDLSVTNTTPASYAGWVELSDDLVFEIPIRTSQLALETISTGTPLVRASQVALETISKGTPLVRMSQFVIETISRTYVPGDVPKTVTTTVAVAQTNTTASLYEKSLTTTVSVDSDAQISGGGDILRSVESTISIDSDLEFRVVPHIHLTSTVTVTPTVTLTDAGPHKFVSSNLNVSQSIVGRNTIRRVTVTTPVVIVTDNRFSPKTQSVDSTIVVASAIAHSTPDHERTITTTVTVQHEVFPQPPVLASASSTLTVAQSVEFVNSTKLLSVSSTVGVSTAIVARGPVPKTVVTPVTITPAIRAVGNVQLAVTSLVTVTCVPTPSNTNVRLTVIVNVALLSDIGFHNTSVPKEVTSNIVVAHTRVGRNAVVRLSVTSTISIAQVIGARNNVIRLALLSSVGVAEDENGRNDTTRISAEDDVIVTDSPTFRANPIHGIFTDLITVTDTNVSLLDKIRKALIDTITVDQLIGMYNPNFAFSDSIAITTDAHAQSSNPRITITHNVSVQSIVFGRNNMIREHVITLCHYLEFGPPFGGPAAVGRNSNAKESVFDSVLIDCAVTGGSDTRETTVLTNVLVEQVARNNEIILEFIQPVNVVSDFVGGPSPRQMSVIDTVTVVSTVVGANRLVRLSLTDSIIVSQIFGPRLKSVPQAVRTSVNVDSIVPDPRIVPHLKLESGITVGQIIRVKSGRETVVSPVTVNQTVFGRNTIRRISVTTPVTVTPRLAMFEFALNCKVTVTPKVNVRRYFNMKDFIDITEILIVTRATDFIIVDVLHPIETVIRNNEANRSLFDVITIPDDFYKRNTSVGSIVVPVVRAYRMDKFITLQTTTSLILLPPPEFDDSENVVGECTVMRSMNGLSYTIIKSSDRKKLNYPFKLSLPKANELRVFLMANMSKPLLLTDWKGQQWYGVITSNPFEITAEARYANQRERISIELEFEAVKL